MRFWRYIVLGLLISAALLLVPGVGLADKGDLESIDQAIAERGLDWVTRDYGGEQHALGLLDEESLTGAAENAEPTQAPQALLALPSGLDWRSNGGNYVSPVKNQASCGSCWAFAAVGSLEANYAIAVGTPGTFLDLSEQFQVSCDTRNLGCSGGWNPYAALFLKETGVPTETCFPYSASNAACANACPDWQSQAVRIAEYERVEFSVQGLKEALQFGPVVVAYNVYQDFDTYGGGVYEYAWGNLRGGHAVLLVGYQDVANQYGDGYFIVKNSWNTWFGESGYFRIGYSQVNSAPVYFGRSAYRYHVVSPGPDAYEPDGDAGSAGVLVAGTPQARSLCAAGDTDWAQFALDEQTDFVLETYGFRGGNTYLQLYNASMQMVANDYSSGEGDYSRIAISLPAGSYWVNVSMYDSSMIISRYYLSLTVPPYTTPATWIDTYGEQAGGWASQDVYPRLLGDVNGDGLDDIVAFSQQAVLVSLSTGAGFAEKAVWLERSFCAVTGWTSLNAYPRILGDVNGDGRDDIIGFGYKKVFVALANSAGSGFEPQQAWLSDSLCRIKGWSSQDVYPRLMGDLNGDGRDDVVGFGYQAICVALASPSGDGFLPQQIWLWDSLCRIKGWSSQSIYPRLLADVDGDGLADIVGFGQQAICVTRSNGADLAPQEIWLRDGLTRNVGWTTQDAYPRLVADANGDGLADLLGFGDDRVMGSLSDGASFGAVSAWNSGAYSRDAGWTSQDTYPRLVGQVGSDIGADIVGFAARGVSVSLANW
jgi:hypothetical protein